MIWSIPMGFETGFDDLTFEFIWIWSIPMGFETKKSFWRRTCGGKFEVSLWDLKLKVNPKYSSQTCHLKYPYGIWNIESLKQIKYLVKEFEVSLWDLKQFSELFLVQKATYLKYPYGIWNIVCFGSILKPPMIWSIPMGFETHSKWNAWY